MYLPPELHEEGQQGHQLCHVEDRGEDGQPSGEEGEVAGGSVDDAGEKDETGVDKAVAPFN